MLHETIRNGDFLAQHSVAMLEMLKPFETMLQRCCKAVLAKNRRCESFRVTSLLI